MRKKLLQQLITYAAAGLACAAVLIGTQTPNPPAPGNGGTIPGIEHPEPDEDDGTQPRVEPQDDRKDLKDDKHK